MPKTKWPPDMPIGNFIKEGKGQQWAYKQGCMDTAKALMHHIYKKFYYPTYGAISISKPDWAILEEQVKKDVGGIGIDVL